MDYKKIETLLDKYYEGQTTLEEEKQIHEFFNKNDFPSELQNEKELFESYQKINAESKPYTKLNEELIDLIEHKWKESTKEKFERYKKWALSVAASIVLFVTSYYFYYNQKPNTLQDTFADEQQAYETTKQVLIYISKTMNSESDKLTGLAQINKNFNNIDKLKSIDKAIKKYKSKER